MEPVRKLDPNKMGVNASGGWAGNEIPDTINTLIDHVTSLEGQVAELQEITFVQLGKKVHKENVEGKSYTISQIKGKMWQYIGISEMAKGPKGIMATGIENFVNWLSNNP